MPRDLKLVQSDVVPLEGSMTIIGLLRYVGPNNVMVEVCSKPLRCCWLPKSCVRSPIGFHVQDVQLEVPLALAVQKGLVSRHNLPPANARAVVRDTLEA